MISVIPEWDGGAGRDRDKAIEIKGFIVTAVEGGMVSGQPSVAVVIDLEGGKWVFAECSMKEFFVAADALKARYGDPRVEPAGAV